MGGKNYIPNEERSIHNGHKRTLAPTVGSQLSISQSPIGQLSKVNNRQYTYL